MCIQAMCCTACWKVGLVRLGWRYGRERKRCPFQFLLSGLVLPMMCFHSFRKHFTQALKTSHRKHNSFSRLLLMEVCASSYLDKLNSWPRFHSTDLIDLFLSYSVTCFEVHRSTGILIKSFFFFLVEFKSNLPA